MRFGVLGGCFDPVHNGHLLIAQDAQEKLKLDKVIFLLSAHPPHKQCQASFALRRQMLRQALRGYPDFILNDVEAKRQTLSYTVETLPILKQQYPNVKLILLIGADQFAELCTWKDHQRLLRLAQFAVMSRAGRKVARRLPRNVQLLETRVIELSSTEIRNRIAQGLSIRTMVPEPVRRLIEVNNLYRAADKERRSAERLITTAP